MKKNRLFLCLLLISLVLSGCVKAEKQVTTTVIQTTLIEQTTTTVPSTVSATAPTTVTTTEPSISEETSVVTTESPTTTTTVGETAKTSSIDEEYSGLCLITVDCRTVKENKDKLKKSKTDFITQSGVILDRVKVGVNDGETAFDVLKRACKENVCTDNCKYCHESGVQLEYNHSAAFDTYYIEGIHQIYEKDCGSMSGWMYSVNGEFPNVGSSAYTVKSGDEIVYSFTCDMGVDIGKAF